MRYISETRHGSLFLSALHEVARLNPVPRSLVDEVTSECEAHVMYLDNHPDAAFETQNQKIANLFCKWIQALHRGDTAGAALAEKDIDKEIENHKFPYYETKSWFGPASRGDINEARNDYYRDWKNPKWGNNDQSFGVIEKTVSESAMIGLIGDWGTGYDDARYLLKDMMIKGMHGESQRIEAILHLGDIYQAGSRLECAQNFLVPIESLFEEEHWPRVPILTIPGNHEYYLLGEGYYPLIDVLNHDLPGWKQSASYFCLRSHDCNWQFLGADTGLGCIAHPLEPGLESSEVEWHVDKITGFQGRTVFMTHHQFVSAFGALNRASSLKNDDRRYYNKRLLRQMGPCLSSIQLWAWGHDHHFMPYERDLPIPCSDADSDRGECQKGLVLQRGQLLGASARRESRDRNIQYGGVPGVRPARSNRPYYNHTYGILDLGAGVVHYYQTPSWIGSVNPGQAAPTGPLCTYPIAGPSAG